MDYSDEHQSPDNFSLFSKLTVKLVLRRESNSISVLEYWHSRVLFNLGIGYHCGDNLGIDL